MFHMTINCSRLIIYTYGCIFLLLASLAGAQPSESPPPYGFSTRFSPSMAIIIVVLISAFFFMGFFSIYIRQCAGDSSARGGSARGAAGGRSRRQPRGLDRAVIETFPTFEYSVVKGLKLGKGTLECAVCLSEFEDDENLRLLPQCSHVFHTDCVDEWLAAHTTCPVCRANLMPGSDGSDVILADADLDVNVPGSEDHPDEVAITVEEDGNQDPQPDVIDRNQIPINRPPRSGSSRRPMRWLSGKFPRSHSTGHSLVRPGENVERFTLRLPEHIRKELIQAKLDRTVSCIDRGESSDGSVRRGRYKIGEGSSRGRSIGRSEGRAKSERWGFAKAAPAFFSRTFSLRSPKGAAAPVENAATTPRSILQSVNCLGVRPENDEQSTPRNLAPVFTVSHQRAG